MAVRALVITNMYPTESQPNYGTFIASQVKSLAPLGVESDVFFIDGRSSKLNYFSAFLELRKRLKAKQYDLIHAHYGFSGIIGRFQRQLPLIVSFCGKDILGDRTDGGKRTLSEKFYIPMHRWLARNCDALIVKSDEMAREANNGAATVIPNGVDFDLFRPLDQLACREQLNLDPNKRYVLFPYNPGNPRKNFNAVSDAITALNAAGDGPVIEALVVKNEPNSRLPIYFNAADALALPSYSEGSPNAVKEALACNVPVVASDVGDIPWLLDGVPGSSVVSPTSDGVAAGLQAAFALSERPNSRDLRQHLRLENAAQAVLDVYNNVLNARMVQERRSTGTSASGPEQKELSL